MSPRDTLYREQCIAQISSDKLESLVTDITVGLSNKVWIFAQVEFVISAKCICEETIYRIE